MHKFQSRRIEAWAAFVESRNSKRYPEPFVGPEGEGADKQRQLEERYLSFAALAKYAP